MVRMSKIPLQHFPPWASTLFMSFDQIIHLIVCLVPGLGRSPGEGKGYPLQDSGLENSMDCIVHGVAKSRTRLSNFHFTSLLLVQHKMNLMGWRGILGTRENCMSMQTTCGIWKGEERMMFQIKAKSICPTHKSYLIKSALKNQPKCFLKNLNDLWAHQGQ